MLAIFVLLLVRLVVLHLLVFLVFFLLIFSLGLYVLHVKVHVLLVRLASLPVLLVIALELIHISTRVIA